jgi:hypothetical protein
MKSQLLRMSMFAVVTAAAVYAQNPQVEKATISFNFIVGSRTMPAGQYTVEDVRPLLILKSADGGILNVITDSIQSLDAQTVGKLVFHRYGNQYFLSEVWTPGRTSGRQVSTTGRERELAAHRAVQTGTTVVAAR